LSCRERGCEVAFQARSLVVRKDLVYPAQGCNIEDDLQAHLMLFGGSPHPPTPAAREGVAEAKLRACWLVLV